MARSTASCSSGESATDGAAAVDLLHVDAGVVAALDRGDDDARARRVEQRERGRLVAAGVLVGVVADDRGVRDRVVDPPVDAREAGRDLVDGAVQVVDPALERDGELDEVLAAAADERPLRVAEPPDARPRPTQATPSPASAEGDARERRRARRRVAETCTRRG